MADYIIRDTTLTAIADSIRAKTGKTDKIAPENMPAEIEGITGGGSAAGCVTVTFMNGDTVLFTRPVYIGDDCPDPYVQNRIELPTKESTAQYDYTFNGWATADGGSADSNVLKKITADKTLYAAYSSAVRYYTISFYDGDTLLTSKQVAYGSTPAHEATKDGYSFAGWTPTPVPVTGDTSYYATWSQKLTFSGSSWSDISDVCEAGEASQHFKVGDTRTIVAGDETYTLRIIALDTDNKADGSGKAGLTIMVDGPAGNYLTTTRSMYTPSSEAWGGSTNSIFRSFLTSTGFNSKWSEELLAVIKPVTKKTTRCNSAAGYNTYTTTDLFFIPSYSEMCDPSQTKWEDGDGIKYPYLYVSAQAIGSANRYFKNAGGTKVAWWTRTAANNKNTYHYVDTSGVLQSDYNGGTKEWYIRPCFCI